MTNHKQALVLLAAILLVGCTASSPATNTNPDSAPSVEQRTLRTLETVDQVRKEVLRSAVRARVNGAITEDQYQQVLSLSRRLDLAWLSASRALELYLLAAESQPQGPETTIRLVALDSAMDEVSELSDEMSEVLP